MASGGGEGGGGVMVSVSMRGGRSWGVFQLPKGTSTSRDGNPQAGWSPSSPGGCNAVSHAPFVLGEKALQMDPAPVRNPEVASPRIGARIRVRQLHSQVVPPRQQMMSAHSPESMLHIQGGINPVICPEVPPLLACLWGSRSSLMPGTQALPGLQESCSIVE